MRAILLANAALVVGAISLGFTSAASAVPFTTSYLDGGNWQTLYAQGFSPAVNPSPAPGAAAGDAVLLSQFQFFKSGTADTAANVQLVILNNLFANLTGLTTSSGAYVGTSTNTIASTAGIATGDPVTFSFNNLSLTYGGNYAAVFANIDVGTGAITPVRVSALAANYADDGTGTFHPTSNYGTESQFNYATSNFINGGFFSTFSFAGDARFSASLTSLPEPTSLAALGIGGVMLVRRRAR